MAKRVITKIVIGVVIALILLYAGAYIFMLLAGRSMIINGLEGLTRKKVTMGNFAITPLFTLQINKLNIQGMAQIDSVSVTPGISSIIRGGLVLDSVKIIRPEVTFEKSLSVKASGSSGSLNQLLSGSNIAPTVNAPVSTPAQAAQKPGPQVIFTRLIIKDGKLHFIDHSAGSGGIVINAKNINFDLRNTFTFPFSVITNFKLSARIPWHEGVAEGKVEVSGWIDFTKRDMRATLDIRDIDGVYLYPYYSKFVDLEKARIQSAKLNFTSDIRGENNDVVVKNHLELSDIVRKPRPAEEYQEKAERITDAVLDAFRMLNGGKIDLDFTFRTKMDKPQFGFKLVKNAIEDKMTLARNSKGFGPEEVVIIPAKIIGGTFKGATGFS
ncbi:MAG: DUF748 domain-containing protein, partial [Candidatus Omnitrophota bacterium]|nr:DUF748 domain-containing protein [Candidatus Omnitrophota bacterium]